MNHREVCEIIVFQNKDYKIEKVSPCRDVACDDCPFSSNGLSCQAYYDHKYKSIRRQAKAWLNFSDTEPCKKIGSIKWGVPIVIVRATRLLASRTMTI